MTDFGREVDILLGIDSDDYPLYDALAEMLEVDEGRENKVYEDSLGNWTCGVGHLLSKGFPDVVIDLLLLCDMKEARDELYKVFPQLDDLDEVRKLVLLNMMFNLGTANFLTFKKFLKAMSEGNYEEASEEMLDSKWARQVKSRALTLSEMMRSGTRA